MPQDSNLSIAANIIGILTFIFAIAAGIYARWLWLRSRMFPMRDFEAFETLVVALKETANITSKLGTLHSEELQDALTAVFIRLIGVSNQLHRLVSMSKFRRVAEGVRLTSGLERLQQEMVLLRYHYADVRQDQRYQ